MANTHKAPPTAYSPEGHATRLLDAHNDSRDLAKETEDEVILLETAQASEIAFTELYRRMATLLQRGAVSREEYEEMLLKRNASISEVRARKERVTELAARKEIKDYLQEVARAKKDVDVEKLYPLYVRVWEAECRKSKHAVDVAQALVRLTGFKYNVISRLAPVGAGSFFELIERRREHEAAEATLRSRLRLDTGCSTALPTIQDVRALVAVPKTPDPKVDVPPPPRAKS